MPIVLVPTAADRTVSWQNDETFVFAEQYLLVTDATSAALDMTKVSLSNSATFANLSSFPKNHKLVVRLEQVSAGGNTLKSPAITFAALQIPSTPVLVSVSGVNNGLLASFTIPQGSPVAQQVVIAVTDLNDMATIEKTMPAVMVNGNYQVVVTTDDNALIQQNSSNLYEVSLFLRNASGDSDVSNVLSGTPTNLPNAPILRSVVSSGTGSVTATWSAPDDSAYWNTTAITLYYYPTSNPSAVSQLSITPLSSLTKIITGLTNGTSYSFKVTYSNAQGEGEASNILTFIPFGQPTPAGAFKMYGYQFPNRVTEVQANFNNPAYKFNLNGEISTDRAFPTSVNYSMSGNGATITGFNVYDNDDTLLKFVPSPNPPLDNGQSISFFGISLPATTPLGTSFTFKLKTVAVSNSGETVLSDAISTSMTLHTNPSPVSGLAAVGLDTQVILSWASAATAGFPIQKYSIRNSSNVELFNTTSTSYSIGNLTNGVSQTYKVVAVTQSDRYLTLPTFTTVESDNNPSASATPHKPPVINTVTISNLVMNLSLTENGLAATNVTAFAVDIAGSSAIKQQALVNNQISFADTALTNITSYMVFVTNSDNQMSNIKYQVGTTIP